MDDSFPTIEDAEAQLQRSSTVIDAMFSPSDSFPCELPALIEHALHVVNTENRRFKTDEERFLPAQLRHKIKTTFRALSSAVDAIEVLGLCRNTRKIPKAPKQDVIVCVGQTEPHRKKTATRVFVNTPVAQTENDQQEVKQEVIESQQPISPTRMRIKKAKAEIKTPRKQRTYNPSQLLDLDM